MARPLRHPVTIAFRTDYETEHRLQRGARAEGLPVGIYVRRIVERAIAEQPTGEQR